MNGRKRTHLVDGLEWQLEAVRKVIPDEAVPVRGALCFTDAYWGWRPKPFRLKSAWIGFAAGLVEAIAADGPLSQDQVLQAANRLAVVLPAYQST